MALYIILGLYQGIKRCSKRQYSFKFVVKWKRESGLCQEFGKIWHRWYCPTCPRWKTYLVCMWCLSCHAYKYCGKICCVTSFVTFQNTCTDRDILLIAIRARCDIRVEDPDYSTNSYRKAAYRQYILWRYKKLGRGNRRVCPSCVVLTIRHIFPADDGNYMGFRRAWHVSLIKHL